VLNSLDMEDHPRGDTRRGRKSLSLTDRAYALLRHEIITCQLPPGCEVSEHELAERLGVSKTPIREALGRLGSEGLVAAFPRRGYRVTPVTIKDMNDLFAVRAVLEGEAAALAARNMTEEDFDLLNHLAGTSYVVGEPKSLETFVNSNRAFHAAIAAGSRNSRLSNLVVGHLAEAERFLYIGARFRDVNVETDKDHHEIVTVLRQRDPESARQMIIQHNENTRRGLSMYIVSGGLTEVTL